MSRTVRLAARPGSSGRAALASRDGTLAVEPSAADEDSIVMDQWRPTPSHRGHAGHPAGPLDRAAIDACAGVATCTTTPLAHAIRRGGARPSRVSAKSRVAVTAQARLGSACPVRLPWAGAAASRMPYPLWGACCTAIFARSSTTKGGDPVSYHREPSIAGTWIVAFSEIRAV
jgi:hypothetical protein